MFLYTALTGLKVRLKRNIERERFMWTKEKELLDQIKKSYQGILSENLIGIYVHGSIAFNCFHWEMSDIDFIVVTKEAPSLLEKEELIKVLLHKDSISPPKGIEMSLVLKKHCKNFIYPTPFELHFSNTHKEECRTNLENYCKNMNGVDKDLAAHFTVIRKSGIVLCGEDIKFVFDAVPKADYIDSIKCDIENAVNDIKENPVYIILNLCRVLAYIKDDLVLSKKQGGQWGMENLPAGYKQIIKKAVNSYCVNEIFSMDTSANASKAFAEYMIIQIFNHDK